MPCNAVAVAVGRISTELAQELETLGTEAVEKALLAFLRRNFADLGTPQLYEAHTGTPFRGIGIVLGDYQIAIAPDGQVVVNTRAFVRPSARNQQVVGQIKDAVTDFITGLAGLAFQKRVSQAIRQAYRVSREQRAPNGALVLQVEL